MEEEFIPYEQALALKELGFDEPCLFAWCNKGGWNKYEMIKEPIVQILKTDGNPFGQFFNGNNWNKEIIPNTKNSIQCSAPLYQQAFRWFRENHNLYAEVKVEDSVKLGGQKFYWIVFGACKSFEGSLWIRCLEDSNGVMSNTYEEAELECLKKLIEIVKQN